MALDEVAFSVGRGEVLGVIGPNGGVLLVGVVKFTRDGIWSAPCDGARRIPALPRSQSKEAV